MKLFLLYLTLVGIPFLGLLGILRIGETLVVPVSIGGIWSIDPPAAQGGQRSCTPIELPDENPEMTVTQSGRYVQVRFNDSSRTSLTGRLDARSLTVREVLPSESHLESRCGARIQTILQVRYQSGAGEADQLSGSWRPECDVCDAVPFQARRLEAR